MPYKKEALRVFNAIKAANLKPRSYSGRGMCGKECVGVSIDKISDLPDSIKRSGASFDNLGCKFIVYWVMLAWDHETMDRNPTA